MSLFTDFIRAAVGVPDSGELGSSGSGYRGSTAPFGAGVLVADDYNPDLRGNLLYNEVDKMRLGDSQVKGGLQAIKLPLLAADWRMEPASDSDKDREIAEWIEKCLNRMSQSWKHTLRQILLYLDYGSMPFETVWETVDDPDLRRPMVKLRKLGPRMPRTVTEWVVDKNGGLAGITQQVETVNRFVEVHIPVEKLLVFVHDQEGNNFRGTSILRAARKDWYYKDILQKIGAMTIEKRGAGIDVGTLTNGSPDKQSKAENALMTVRSHQRAFMLENEDFKYRIESLGQGGVVDALPWIKYYDFQILRGMIAEFLGLGSDGTGSLAMSRDKSTFFLMALRGIGEDIVEVFNRHLIPKWVDYNWPGVTDYPKLEHSRLDRRDAATVIEGLAKLIPIGGITIDEDIENEVRELLELPELVTGAASARAVRAKGDVDYVRMERELDTAEDRIMRVYKPIQERQIEVISNLAAKAVDEDDASALDNITVPYKREAADAIYQVLVDLYQVGQEEAVKELKLSAARVGRPIGVRAQLDPTRDSNVKAFLKARALTMASVLSSRLKGSLMRNSLDMIRKGERGSMVLKGQLKDLSDRAIRTEAGLTVSEALNIGRQAAAEENEAKYATFSSVLDSGTCPDCERAEGTRVELDTDRYERYQTPYQECQGRGRCRCVLIFTFEENR